MADDLTTYSLQKAADRIIPRIADAYILSDDGSGGTQWLSLGILEGVSIEFETVTQNADVAGREKPLAIDFSVSMVLQQTAQEEFGNVYGIVTPSGAGHTIKVCDDKTAAVDVDTASGFEFKGVLPRFSGEINGSGEGSSFTIEFGARVLLEEFDAFDGTITVDI